MRVFFVDLKRTIFSLLFIGVAGLYVILMNSQLQEDGYYIEKPKENQASYGDYVNQSLEVLYPQMIEDLIFSLEQNYFATYPMGFYRQVQVNQEEKDLIQRAIEKMTSYDYQELLGLESEELREVLLAKIPQQQVIEEQLVNIDALLGGGSFFSPKMYKNKYGHQEKDYAKALEDYYLMEEHGFDLVHTRLYLDYAGIYISLLAWFLPVGLWLADRQPGIRDTVYNKSISTSKLFFSRFAAYVLAILLIVGIHFTFFEGSLVQHYGLDAVNILASYALVLVWLLPIILVNGSLSSLITLTSHSPIAIVIGLVSWFIVNLMGAGNIEGSYGWKFIPRHNVLGNQEYFVNNFRQLIYNRVLWLFLAGLIIVFSLRILKDQREGHYVRKMVSPRKK